MNACRTQSDAMARRAARRDKMLKKGSWGSANALAKLAAVAVVAATMSGCTHIPDGSVGIVIDHDGTIEMEPVTHTVGDFWQNVIEIDVSQTRIALNNLQPKDALGTPLQKLDLNVTVQLNPSNVPAFYKATKELDTYVDDSNVKYTTLGKHVVEMVTQIVAQQETEKVLFGDIAKSSMAFQSQFKANMIKDVQAEMDRRYPGAMKILSVDVMHFDLPPSLADQSQKQSALDSESNTIDAELKLNAKRQQLEDQRASLDAHALAAAAKNSGLSPEVLIAWRNAKAYEEQAQGMRGSPVTVLNTPPAVKQ